MVFLSLAANIVVEAPPEELGGLDKLMVTEPDVTRVRATIRAHMLPLRRRLR